MRHMIVVLFALALFACDRKGSTDTVDDSSATTIKGAVLIEGTTNDASALEEAAQSNNIAELPAPEANATEANESDPRNSM